MSDAIDERLPTHKPISCPANAIDWVDYIQVAVEAAGLVFDSHNAPTL